MALSDRDQRSGGNLQAFCHAVGCAPADASSDGIHVDMLLVLDVMRQRGYRVGQPAHAPCQVRKGRTIWHVLVTLPADGPSLNRTAHLPGRRQMIQRWADYLDLLRKGVKP